jgi:hypothetical protein
MENTEIEEVEIQEVLPNGTVVYQQDKAAIDVQISTAMAYPRNVKRSIEDAIAIVTMDKETASTCTYSVPRGGKPVTGPSVHLAKILAQSWGNMRIDAKVVSIDAKHVTSESVSFDLQKNIAFKVQVKRSIVGKYGRFNDDMITVTGNAANSIAMRNSILCVIPRAVVDRVYNEAKKTITGDISDETKLLKRRKQVFDGFKETYGVSEAEVLSVVDRAAVDHITGDDLVVLIGIAQAIKDGDTSVELAFRSNGKSKPSKTNEEIESERFYKVLAECKTTEEVFALSEKAITNEQKTALNLKADSIMNEPDTKKPKK